MVTHDIKKIELCSYLSSISPPPSKPNPKEETEKSMTFLVFLSTTEEAVVCEVSELKSLFCYRESPQYTVPSLVKSYI